MDRGKLDTPKRRARREPLQQVAALPFRVRPDSGVELMLISSRETRRFVIPKGWPMAGRKSWKAAQIEARQEAGVVGEIGRKKFGSYKYWKRLEGHFALTKVAVYPLEVRRELADWPERNQRYRRWLVADDAALLVDEPELAALILAFAGRLQSAAPADASPADGKLQPVS
ncbi:MAG TPA: NUDIX hydrolase [Xanthobacteraceae bacterium]|nr:NUDIX hydrolase [Xanthobacteraceae bacterium]